VKYIATIPGDGIGPDVVAEAVKALTAVADTSGFSLDFIELPMGGVAIDRSGTPLPAATLEACKASDAVLLGAVGGPKWDGLAGAAQVTSVYHRLIPSISSGYGYTGLMVAMLVNYSPIFAAPVALFFAALNVGSIQLPIVLRLDSSLAGVIQGFLVLFVLLGNGARTMLLGKKRGNR